MQGAVGLTIRNLLFTLGVVLLIVGGAGGARAQDAGAPKVYSGAINDDIFTSGQSVNINAEVSGDIFAIGGMINVSGTAARQVVAAGGQLNLDSAAAGDVLAVGGTVDAGGSVGGNLVLAGMDVRISSQAARKIVVTGLRVDLMQPAVADGSVWLGGRRVDMHGTVKGDLYVAASEANLQGSVQGNATIEAETVTVAPGAHVNGSLTVKGPHAPQIAKGAVIAGGVHYTYQPGFEQAATGWIAAAFLLPVIFLFVTGGAIILLLPAGMRRTARELTARPLASLGLGILIILGGPAVILVFLATVIGLPLAVIAFAIYVVALLAGPPLAGVALAQAWLARKGAEPGRWAVAGLYLLLAVVFLVIELIPVIGGILWLIALGFGVGAGTLAVLTLSGAADEAQPG